MCMDVNYRARWKADCHFLLRFCSRPKSETGMTPSIDSHSTNTEAPSIIPVIDFSKFLNGTAEQKLETAQEMIKAFSNSGFIYLSNHGVSKATISQNFAASKQLFDKPLQYKLDLEWESAESNRGYVPQGREKLTELDKHGRFDEIEKLRKANPDLKETFEIGKRGDVFMNRIPADWPEFETITEELFDEMQTLNVNVMNCINLGLDLPDDFLSSYVNKSENTLRLLHYPQVPESKLSEESRRAGAHCDYGSVTLLLQDDSGGLEVMDYKTNNFVKATPIPNTIVVNVGDMLQRWSNDRLKSTLHRVVRPYKSTNGVFPERYSIAYFCNPNFDSFIECLPTCWSIENPKKYEGINSFDYLVSRLKSTYA